MLGRVVSASDLDGFSVDDESLFHFGRLVDEGLGCGGHARRLAEPVGALRICELGMGADECADDPIQGPFECSEEGELGRVDEIFRCRRPIDLRALGRV